MKDAAIIRWLNTSVGDPSSIHELAKKREPTTGRWFIKSNDIAVGNLPIVFSKDVPAEPHGLYKRNDDRQRQPTHHQLIETPNALAKHSPTYIIMDALDEFIGAGRIAADNQ
jgi:hypothetical protein